MGPGISYRDWFKRAESGGQLQNSVYVGTQVLPLENAQTPRLREYASFSSSAVGIRMNFNGGVLTSNEWTGENGLTVGCVGLFNINFGLGGSARVKVYANNNNSTPVMNKNYIILAATNYNLEHTQTNLFLVFDQVYTNVQRVEIELQSSINFDMIGRIWVGNYLDVDFDSGWSIGLDTKSQVNYSQGRDAHPIFRRRKRKASFPVSMLNFEQAFGVHSGGTINNVSTFNDMFMTAGKDSEIVVQPISTDFSQADHPPLPTTIYGLMSKDPALIKQAGDNYETLIDVVELI